MARIRSLKPEALQHRKVGRLSDRAFRLWVGMLTQADDEGRLVADPEHFRVVCFGYNLRVKTSQVVAAMAELFASGLIRLYQVNGTRYADFPSWQDHQVVNKPSPSFLPRYDASDAIHGLVTDQSRIDPEGSTLPDRPDLIDRPDLEHVPIAALMHRADFERFWAVYPRKVGKGYAHTCFLRAVQKTTIEIILAAVEQQQAWPQWSKEGGRFIPNPSTWLNQERWNDEPSRVRAGTDLPGKTRRNVEAAAAFTAAKKDKPW